MTLNEYNDMVRGYTWRMEREYELTATLGAWILRGLGVKDITPDKLLGRTHAPKRISITEKDAELLLLKSILE